MRIYEAFLQVVDPRSGPTDLRSEIEETGLMQVSAGSRDTRQYRSPTWSIAEKSARDVFGSILCCSCCCRGWILSYEMSWHGVVILI